jgi:hypothetical protein
VQASRAGVVRRQREKIGGAETPYIIGVFDESKKFARDFARSRSAAHCARRLCSSRRNMWCRCGGEHASLSENAGFFVAL